MGTTTEHEAMQEQEPIGDWSDAPEAATEGAEVETEGKAGESAPKKLISLRVSVEDLELAKSLAGELNIGYQTLINQLIHDGLLDTQQEVRTRRLVAQLRGSLPEVGAAQQLLDSPAVKAAKALLADPAVKAAQQLVDSPAVKAAQDFAQEVANNPTVQQVRDFGASSYAKASEDLASSPLAKALKELSENPTVRAAQELAESTSAKVVRDFQNSPMARLSRELAKTAGMPVTAQGEELKELTKAVDEIRDALKKANLM